jgi:ABC-type multidrug transport system ATPase subunit
MHHAGMKRRLSVAISLVGSPKVAYLDEPSTGLDPAARRNLWQVVRDAKAGKAIILTTHSMEEAEVLCDRLGIFVNGRLVCIGNPKQLTARYGGYYVCLSSPCNICNATSDCIQALALVPVITSYAVMRASVSRCAFKAWACWYR